MKKEFYNIANLVTKNAKILDVGCGNGELMKYITENISKDIRGIELSKSNVQKCVEKGLTVIEGDAEKDLRQFPDNSFDFVILSQTLQAFLDPENVLNELLRIGKKAIVSIPNFGHWKVRLHLLLKGTMPVTENLPNEWYNTPNLHMCTIKDFYNFCDNKFLVQYQIALALPLIVLFFQRWCVQLLILNQWKQVEGYILKNQ